MSTEDQYRFAACVLLISLWVPAGLCFLFSQDQEYIRARRRAYRWWVRLRRFLRNER